MQTCADCGARNEDGELFCGACGTYLEWEEQQVGSGGAGSGAGSSTTAELAEVEEVTEPGVEQVAGPEVGEADEPRAEPGADPAGTTGTTGTAGTATTGHTAEPGAGTHTATEARVPAAASSAVEQGTHQGTDTSVRTAPSPAETPGPARTGGPEQAAAPPGGRTTSAAPAPAPVRPAASSPRPVKPAAVVPAPVRPAAAKPRRHVPPTAKDEPPPAPGDLICGACGAGNAPHRNFCRRCGASLADAPTQGRDGWWRRWRARRAARKDGPKAGTRPKRRRRRRFPVKTVVLLVVLALLGGGGYYFRDELGTAYNTVLDRVAGNDPVNPTAVTASSSAPDRGPELARDGISDASWAPEATGDGAGEWLQFEFGEPFRLVTVLLTAGASTEDETRLLEARPSRVRLTVTTEDGQEQITDVDVLDTGEPQPIPIPVSDVVALRMTILSSYGAADDVHVAVAEVEFRGR